jgi:excisionase family DNA binding protein
MADLRLAAERQVDPGMSLEWVGGELGCDRSTVVRLMQAGDLRGYRVGRGVRVYLSSVEEYRQRNAYQVRKKAPKIAPRRGHPARVREAMATLKSLGID